MRGGHDDCRLDAARVLDRTVGGVDHAWDGLGASIVGAAVTVVALVITLRFERGHSRRERLNDEGLRLMHQATEFKNMLMSSRLSGYHLAAFDWKSQVNTFYIAAEDPCFQAMMQAALETLGAADAGGEREIKDVQAAVTAMQNAETLLRRWIFTPQYFDYFRSNKAECERRVQMIRDGWV